MLGSGEHNKNSEGIAGGSYIMKNTCYERGSGTEGMEIKEAEETWREGRGRRRRYF